MRQHRDYPDDKFLADNVLNQDLIQVVSRRLKDFIGQRNLLPVEWLPISLVDCHGKLLSRDYFIMHPIDPIDAVDRQNSIFEMSLLIESDFESFTNLVLDESKIPSDRDIFQLRGFGDVTFIRRSLADQITAGKYSGIRWIELADYPEI